MIFLKVVVVRSTVEHALIKCFLIIQQQRKTSSSKIQETKRSRSLQFFSKVVVVVAATSPTSRLVPSPCLPTI